MTQATSITSIMKGGSWVGGKQAQTGHLAFQENVRCAGKFLACVIMVASSKKKDPLSGPQRKKWLVC